MLKRDPLHLASLHFATIQDSKLPTQIVLYVVNKVRLVEDGEVPNRSVHWGSISQLSGVGQHKYAARAENTECLSNHFCTGFAGYLVEEKHAHHLHR